MLLAPLGQSGRSLFGPLVIVRNGLLRAVLPFNGLTTRRDDWFHTIRDTSRQDHFGFPGERHFVTGVALRMVSYYALGMVST
jgi:hypothetical protein